MSVTRVIALAAAAALIAPLGACDSGTSLKSALGFDRQPPDEFTVVVRAPLSLPPDYALRPPRAGALRPQETTPTEVAKNTVFHAAAETSGSTDPPPADDSRTTGEAALLKRVGADSADPNIRNVLASENSALLESDRRFIDTLIFWRTPEAPGVIVDPVGEAQRLRENDAEGKPATEGETPIIERKKKGFLEGIF